MTVIIFRALIFYFLLMLMMKLMGKRQIGEMQLTELITTVMLSEMAVLPLTDTDIPVTQGLLPLLLISSLEVVIAFAEQKSKGFRRFLNGNPIVLYEKGRFVEKNLEKARVSTEDVEAMVRVNGYATLDEVSCVILEISGKMSVLPKKSNKPNQSGV